MKKANLWNMHWAAKTGIRHEHHQLLRQDRCCYKEDGNCQVIALADGTSHKDICVIGIEKMLESLSEYVLKRNEDFIKMLREGREEEVKRNVKFFIDRILNGLQFQYRVPKTEFGSTILLACIDVEKDFFFCLHLADGIIVYKEEEYHILSEPFYYSDKNICNFTCLSTFPDAEKYMKVYWGELGKITEILLLSDGTYQMPLFEEEEKSYLESAEEIAVNVRNSANGFAEKMDDQCAIMLCENK